MTAVRRGSLLTEAAAEELLGEGGDGGMVVEDIG